MCRTERGFSLLEMLLVLFVVVLLTSLVTLNLGGDGGGREARQTLTTLRAAAAYAIDEAQFSGRDFGLLVQRADDGSDGLVLRWRERLPQGWRAPERSAEIFADIRPAGDLTLILDGEAVIPAAPGAAVGPADTLPQWLFLASGETQSGELLLRHAQSAELLGRLSWDALGRFEADWESAPEDLVALP